MKINWEALSAVGQILSAAIALCAFLMTLKQSKYGAKINVQLLWIAFGEDNKELASPIIKIENIGNKEIKVVEWGIVDKEKQEISLTKEPFIIPVDEYYKITVDMNTLRESVKLLNGKEIKFWIEDKSGRIYYSKEYVKIKDINKKGPISSYFG